MITARALTREEVGQIWQIDRSEVVEHIFTWEDGQLVRRTDHYDIKGWPPGEADIYNPILLDCFDRGGWFRGLFVENIQVGVVVLESQFIGFEQDQLQLKFLHISRSYRGKGLGQQLFKAAREEARRRGARRMYISATPSEHTIHFYLKLGCWVCDEPEPELYALEPDDIHLLCDV